MDQDVRYTAVSSFIFLRFFAPAILSPNLFHLRPHHPVSHCYQAAASEVGVKTCVFLFAANKNVKCELPGRFALSINEASRQGGMTWCHFVLLGPSDVSNPYSDLKDHPDTWKSRQVQICECFILLTRNHAVCCLEILIDFSLCFTPLCLKANFKESYMATFYDYFNEQKYADAVKNVSVPTPFCGYTLSISVIRKLERLNDLNFHF